MTIVLKSGVYKAPADAPYGKELAANNWRAIPALGCWLTSDISKVAPLLAYCDVAATEKVTAWLSKRQAAVAPSIAADAPIDIPAPPGMTYRGYQRAGIAFMKARLVSLNADAPRLGKTIQSLGLVNLHGGPARTLIICPANAKINWCNEARKWLIHQTSIGYCNGDLNPNTDFMSINYDILGRHLNSIGSREWDYIFVDEAHVLGNEKSLRTRQVMPLRAKKHMVFLTGTPVFTRPVQFWPMLQVLDPQDLGASYWRYVKRYCDAHKDDDGRWDFDGASNGAELQFRMREKFMIRREKTDVSAELPTSRQTVVLPKTGLDRLVKAEKKALGGRVDALMARLKGEMSETDWAALAACDDDSEGTGASERRALAIAKTPMVVDFVEDLLKTERKVVVFTFHRDVTTAISAALAPYGVATLIGGMSATRREEERLRFQDDPDCRVCVGNITVAGSAVELSASDTIVYAELSWVPSDMDQSEERIWLPTKTNPLMIYKLVVEDSLDQIMAGVLEDRQAALSRMFKAHHMTNVVAPPT